MFKNSTRAFVEETIWENKERKYIANYGIPFDVQTNIGRWRGVFWLHLWSVVCIKCSDQKCSRHGRCIECSSMYDIEMVKKPGNAAALRHYPNLPRQCLCLILQFNCSECNAMTKESGSKGEVLNFRGRNDMGYHRLLIPCAAGHLGMIDRSHLTAFWN
jgi:hypothetical protein